MLSLLGAWLGNSPKMAVILVAVACLLPYVWTIIAKTSAGFRPSDNQNPRAFLAKTTGLSARANAAQENSFEGLPFFVAGVLLAMYCFVPQVIINALAFLYVLLRLAYGGAYLANLASLRSVLWFLSMACVAMLFWLSLRVL